MIKQFSENHWLTVRNNLSREDLSFIVQSGNDAQNFTYGDLFSASQNCAAYLSDLRIRKNKFIPIVVDNSIESIINIFGIWFIGAVPVLINPKLTSPEFKHIFVKVQSNKIIVPNNFDVSVLSKSIQAIKYCTLDTIISDSNFSNSEFNIGNPAVVIFTSGTTGEPKGVVHTFQSLLNSFSLGNKFFNYSESNKWLLSLPAFHIGGFSILLRSLLSGAKVVIPNSSESAEILKVVEHHKPDFISFVPTQLKRLLDTDIIPHENNKILLGGGQINSELVSEAINKGWNVYKLYGSSETAAFISVLKPEDFPQHPDSAGKLLENVTVNIEEENDSLHLEQMVKPCNRILISSPTLFKYYLNDEEMSSNKLKNGKYNTGDYGFMRDGFLYIVNRRTDIIISGGENIDPTEIENVLNDYPAIKEASVIGKSDEEWGEIVCAVIVLNEKAIFDLNDLKAYLENRIANYKIPKKYFITDILPTTALGKVKKEELKNHYSV